MIEQFGNEERQLLAQILMDNERNRITPALANGIVVTFAHELARRAQQEAEQSVQQGPLND